MVEVIVNEGKLILGIPWTGNYFVKPLEFPLENIAGVGVDLSLPRAWLRRLEFLAAAVPGVLRKGVYYEDANCVYWEVKDPDRTIVISLRNEPYEKLIVEVANPPQAIEIIEKALKNKGREIEETDNSTEEEEPVEI